MTCLIIGGEPVYGRQNQALLEKVIPVPYRLLPVDNPAAPPLEVSSRLRSQLVYFMTPPDEPHVPPLEPQDYWIDAAHSARWFADGVFELVSPLDGEQRTTIELSEEQEILMEWLTAHQIQHVRIQEIP